MSKLSIIIPSRNEPYLQKTIDDIFKHSEADIEVVVGFDGCDIDHSISGCKIYNTKEPIGQRAMQNKLVELSNSKYIMKLDAHCSLQQGFDRIMLESMEDNMVMTPILCRLRTEHDNWTIEPKPFTKKYYFDTNMIFQYATKEEEDKDDNKLVETMALQGSCFVVERDTYFKWNLCDEKYGSWGFQGSEVACKTWLNGGRVVTNTDVFYGHMFRTDNLPYTRPKKEVDEAMRCAQQLKKHPKMEWLVKKFNYPCDWTDDWSNNWVK